MAEFLLHARILPPSGSSGKHIFLLHKPDNSNRDHSLVETTDIYQPRPKEEFKDMRKEDMNGTLANNNRKQYYVQKQRIKNHYD